MTSVKLGCIVRIIQLSLIVILNGGVFIYVLRSFKSQIDGKAEKNLCNERHDRINTDLSREREEFKDLRQDIKTLTMTQGKPTRYWVRSNSRLRYI